MKLGIAGVLWVGFAVGAFSTVTELRYEIWGQSATGKIISAHTESRRSGGRYRRRKQYLVLNYEFSDDEGTTHAGEDSVRASTSLPQQTGQPVEIQFLRGAPQSSRLAANSRRMGYLILLGCGAGLAGYYWKRRQQTA